jgi:hypothetical protein
MKGLHSKPQGENKIKDKSKKIKVEEFDRWREFVTRAITIARITNPR